MRVIGYHISNGIVANSDGEVTTEPPYLDFLLQPKENSIKIFYHIGYNVANLLKAIKITEQEAKKLHDTEELYITPYKLKYAPNKFISISKGFYKGSPFVFFCDANQYIPAQLDNNNTPEACLAKATQAKEAGEQVYKALCSIGLHPTTLTSPVRVYEKEVLSKIDLPTVDDIPEDAGFYAYQCCKGNWLEAFQVGHWERAWDYDINSAYPAELAQLPDLRGGEWEHTDGFYEDGLLGYYKGKVTIKASFSPIIYARAGKGFGDLNYTPTGSWETYLTKREIDFIHEWNLGEFEVEDGWYWELTKDKKNVLRKYVIGLQAQKETMTGLGKDTIKRVMSGIYGKLLEIRMGDFGERFNPVYGAEVETNTRLKVAGFALQNKVMPMHIAVDGMLLDRPVKLSGDGISKWKLTAEQPCIVAGTGVVALKGREQTGDFSLSYDWLKEQIEQHPEEKGYKVKKMSPVTLAVALNGDNWNKLGQLHEITRTVDIGNEQKRCYRESPKCGRDLLSRQYSSEPWDISMVSRLT